MLILAIESTTEACSVALNRDGNIVELFEIAPRQHTKLLLSMVDTLLKDNQVDKQLLDAIAFCRGPGAFTGLRITTGVAQGLAFGLNIPLIGISSLATLAQGAYRHSQLSCSDNKSVDFLSCLDARKNEVFWGMYTIKEGYALLVNEEQVTSSQSICECISQQRYVDTSWQVVGTACEIIAKLNEPSLTIVDLPSEYLHYPHAYDVALLAAKEFNLGNLLNAEQAVPVYLRNNVTY